MSGISDELRRLIGARQTSHDWYSGGMDHYNGPVDNGHEWKKAASQWVNERNGGPTVSPWINTFDHANELAYNRMRQDNYNAFLGNEGGWVGDENFPLTGNSEGYTDDSIAAWFKNAFAGEDMVQHRRNAIKSLQHWNSTDSFDASVNSNYEPYRYEGQGGKGVNRATTAMTEELFNQMGLADKYGLEYQAGAGGPSDPVHSTPLPDDGMMSTSWLDLMKDGVSAFNEKWNANRRNGNVAGGMLAGMTGGPRPNTMSPGEPPKEFSGLPNQGMMKQDGPNRDLVYAKLMEKLGG